MVLFLMSKKNLRDKGVDKKQVVDITARAQEIIRVSDEVIKNAHDVNTANLASTTSSTLSSDETQLTALLKKNKIKVASKELSIYTNKNTDTEIQSAIQNNRLSEYYYSYLKKNLTAYQAAIKTSFETTSSVSLKNVLSSSYASTKIILTSQQLATTQ
jgi:hypothetical protein